MKTALKQFLDSQRLFSWLVKPAQWMLGMLFRLRAYLAFQLLAVRLLLLWLSVRKPLLVFSRFGGIGDIICSFPTVEALIRRFPSCHPVYVTRGDYATLPSASGLGVTVIGSARHCAVPQLPLKILAHCFTPATAKELGMPTTARSLIAEFFVACGLEPEATVPHLRVFPEALSKVKSKVNFPDPPREKIVVIHTGPSWRTREWPEERWQILIDRLHARFPVRILHVGMEHHVTLGQQKIGQFSGTERLIGKLNLQEMAALFTMTDLFLGIDSGMLHIAKAVGTVSIAVFGPTAPEYVSPGLFENGLTHSLPCSFCDYRIPVLHWQSNCPHEIACMYGISVDQVLARCEAVLASDLEKHGTQRAVAPRTSL